MKATACRGRLGIECDCGHQNIPYRVFIVQQESGLPFNRGALSIGFVLGRDHSDYTCFHDVDYLPAGPITVGLTRPPPFSGMSRNAALVVEAPRTAGGHKLEDFFGGVVLTPNALFEQVNGYANTYWGWGWEDRDLKYRYQSAAITFTRRKGSFQGLDHDHDGYTLNGAMPWLTPTPKPTTLVNERHCNERRATDGTALKQVDDAFAPLDDDSLKPAIESLNKAVQLNGKSAVPQMFKVELLTNHFIFYTA